MLDIFIYALGAGLALGFGTWVLGWGFGLVLKLIKGLL